MDALVTRVEGRRGREEIRALLLRSAVLAFEEQKGRPATDEFLLGEGLVRSELEHDSTWVSLPLARRILTRVAVEIGDQAISERHPLTRLPEGMGISVTMLRRTTSPLDAYQSFPTIAVDSWRVGRFAISEEKRNQVTMVYYPTQGTEPDQAHRCFCLLRQAELRVIPRLWDLEPARLTETSCIAHGDPFCSYELSFRQPGDLPLPPWAPIAFGLISGALALPAGLATSLACFVGLALAGYGVQKAVSAFQRTQALRAFEAHRIDALEHSLDQHGSLRARGGDLTQSVLGGKYQILRPVGSGGIGTVYAAEHLGLGFQVAVKVLRGAAAVDASEVARLRREARVQMSIEHPNVVRTFDLDQLPDGTLYVVMELLQGMSLHELMQRGRRLSYQVALPHFIQVCRALSAAHKLGIVHRDLKPANVFLCEGGIVKVLDFGMSKLAEDETLTQEGYTLGTPEYMSPEQCSGGEVEPRSDIYALGVLMYEALSGGLPFRGKTRQKLLEHHQLSTPESLLTRHPELNLPPSLDQIIMACLKKHPDQRPASADELEQALTKVLEDSRQKVDSSPGGPS